MEKGNDEKKVKLCNVCGEPVEKLIDFPTLDGTGILKPVKVQIMCKCRREEKEAHEKRMQFEEEQRRINELRKLSLMDVKLKEVRLSTYRVTNENEKIFNIAKRYVEKFDDMFEKSQGLLFHGDVGTGKSYTAAAIANELLDKMHPVVMTSFIKILEKTGSFEKPDDTYFDMMNKAKLLVIDDFGAERGTDYALERVYNIIDSRYRSGKPLILTTNIELGSMMKCDDIRYSRIYDRILEMCYPVKMTGTSWRKKEAVKRFDKMKEILEG